MPEREHFTSGLCFDQRSERSTPLKEKRDISVDQQTFIALVDHVGEGLFTRSIKYYGVMASRKDYPADIKKGKKHQNCINHRYTNIFITRSDGFFHVYVLKPKK